MVAEGYVVALDEVGAADVAFVGGKNASLGEMIASLSAAGIRVPGGFATTSRAYRDFLAANGLREHIAAALARLERDPNALAAVGAAIRDRFATAEFPTAVAKEIMLAYADLAERLGEPEPAVAVRSSATAEDLPEASFAGQQETFLNVRGEADVLDACRRCFASVFTDRAIAYRARQGMDHLDVSLSVGVQKMVRAESAAAGVMFSIDTETGFPEVVLVDASWGLGEAVVAGMAEPDSYIVFKPLLEDGMSRPIVHKHLGAKGCKVVYDAERSTKMVETSARERAQFVLADEEILQLARWAVAIERHYGRPMDIEWAKDGDTGELFVVQARPETVQARREAGSLKTYELHDVGPELLRGIAVGSAIGTGRVCNLASPSQSDRFPAGGVLVTGMTDPDWVPIMKKAAAIVTDHGGRTSHAAIVSRELGIPAIVGAGNATELLVDGQEVTVSCCEGDIGIVYEGVARFEERAADLSQVPATRTKVMLNLAEPAAALRWWRLPADGIGLARIEFIVDNDIKIHPLALARFHEVDDADVRAEIERITAGWDDKKAFFVDRLAYGVARIAISRYPDPVIVRLSDFKTNEYADLIGGRQFEPTEHNPMLGWRGASRYYSDEYRDGFALECAALRKVRDEIGLTNVVVMVPFCRTLDEADRVLAVMADNGLERGGNGLQIYVMAEIPSNILLAEKFAERFDGFSIGSNDLTQLVLGVDRDSETLARVFDERNEAVQVAIAHLIERAHRHGRPVGLCGQAPSDHPSYARFLVEAGIDSLSVAPDSFLHVKRHVAAAEADLPGR